MYRLECSGCGNVEFRKFYPGSVKCKNCESTGGYANAMQVIEENEDNNKD